MPDTTQPPDLRGRRMLEFAREVVSTLDLDLVLHRVLETARELTGARYAALGVLDEQRDHLERFLTVGIDDETKRRIGPFPRGHGVLGELIRNPVPLRLQDVGEHPRSYGFPLGHPPMRTFLGVPILIHGTAFGNLYLAEKADGPFDEADEDAVVTLAGWAAVAIENARVHHSVARRRDELEQSVAALSAMMDIALALGGETHVDAVLELVVKRARALVSARAMALGLLAGPDVVFAAIAGELPPGLRGTRMPLAETVADQVIHGRTPQRLSDDLNRMRFERHGLGGEGVEATTGLVVPLLFRDRALGVLMAFDRLTEGPEFSARDEQLLLAYATAAAAAIATARSVEEDVLHTRLAAAESERRRWARELHDDTLQALAMLRMTLSAAGRKGEAEALADAVAVALEHIDTQISNLRGLIAELRPTALDDLGVGAALEAFVERAVSWGGRIDVDVDLDYEAGRTTIRHPPALEAAIYRIAQEAITNAVKHAAASHVRVSLAEGGGTVRICVEDDGAGFDPASTGRGFGLTSMRERAELAGGDLAVTSAPGAGTKITARLPATPTERADGGVERAV
jgi:signal transduction histidine kinase